MVSMHSCRPPDTSCPDNPIDEPTAHSDGQIVYGGYLKKLPPLESDYFCLRKRSVLTPFKRLIPSWRKRYFVLRKPTNGLPDDFRLEYYRNKEDVATGKSKRQIDLQNVTSLVSDLETPDGKLYCFCLKVADRAGVRDYYFSAYSTSEMDEWVYHLCQIMDLCLESDMDPSDAAVLPPSNVLAGVGGGPAAHSLTVDMPFSVQPVSSWSHSPTASSVSLADRLTLRPDGSPHPVFRPPAPQQLLLGQSTAACDVDVGPPPDEPPPVPPRRTQPAVQQSRSLPQRGPDNAVQAEDSHRRHGPQSRLTAPNNGHFNRATMLATGETWSPSAGDRPYNEPNVTHYLPVSLDELPPPLPPESSKHSGDSGVVLEPHCLGYSSKDYVPLSSAYSGEAAGSTDDGFTGDTYSSTYARSNNRHSDPGLKTFDSAYSGSKAGSPLSDGRVSDDSDTDDLPEDDDDDDDDNGDDGSSITVVASASSVTGNETPVCSPALTPTENGSQSKVYKRMQQSKWTGLEPAISPRVVQAREPSRRRVTCTPPPPSPRPPLRPQWHPLASTSWTRSTGSLAPPPVTAISRAKSPQYSYSTKSPQYARTAMTMTTTATTTTVGLAHKPATEAYVELQPSGWKCHQPAQPQPDVTSKTLDYKEIDPNKTRAFEMASRELQKLTCSSIPP